MESTILDHPTVRHNQCSFNMAPSSTHSLCPACKKHRSSLLIQAKRRGSAVHTSNLTNHRYLPRPVLVDRLQKRSACIREQSRQLNRLKQRLREDTDLNGDTVSKETREDIALIVQRNASFTDSLPPSSFKRLFWE